MHNQSMSNSIVLHESKYDVNNRDYILKSNVNYSVFEFNNYKCV